MYSDSTVNAHYQLTKEAHVSGHMTDMTDHMTDMTDHMTHSHLWAVVVEQGTCLAVLCWWFCTSVLLLGDDFQLVLKPRLKIASSWIKRYFEFYYADVNAV